MAIKKKYIDTALITIHPKSSDYFMASQEKESIYNSALITLRKKFRQLTDNNKQIAFKMMHFNKMVKSQYQDEIVNVIKMYLREDNFEKSIQLPERPEISEDEKQRLLREGRVMMTRMKNQK